MLRMQPSSQDGNDGRITAPFARGVVPPRLSSPFDDAQGNASTGLASQPFKKPSFMQQDEKLRTNWYNAPSSSKIASNATNSLTNIAASVDGDLDEPPLLEELGIYPEYILARMKAVLFFYRLEHDFLRQCDMCGPLCIAIALGFCHLLSGKPSFGYIYGLGIVGCFSTYILLNLMGQTESIDLYRTMSILGYGLLPIVGLAIISIFFSLRSIIGAILSILCILWCTATASRFFETVRPSHG
ncbi:putative protein yipf5, partial [Cardiosporidium cionae]